jgi:hypothetical protein
MPNTVAVVSRDPLAAWPGLAAAWPDPQPAV